MPTDGFLAVELSGLADEVDVDVHLLTDLDAGGLPRSRPLARPAGP
ncbi:MAG: hypothetical protein R3F60_26160 [bacterium]